jgi:hypothetical protein
VHDGAYSLYPFSAKSGVLGQEGVLPEAKMKVFQAIHTILPIKLQVILQGPFTDTHH